MGMTIMNGYRGGDSVDWHAFTAAAHPNRMSAAVAGPVESGPGALSFRVVSMQQSDECDLADVAAVLDGDEEAFARIVDRHSVVVQKQMRNFARDPAMVEELTQDVFVEAFLGLGKFRGDAPFRHWLARIATLTGYNFWKKRDKRKNLVPLHDNMELVGVDSPPPGDPDEAAKLLFDLLATLPADDRMAMTLMYLEKLGQDEIAERMGWTRVMVAVRLYRAKQKLKKLGDSEPWKGRLEWMLS